MSAPRFRKPSGPPPRAMRGPAAWVALVLLASGPWAPAAPVVRVTAPAGVDEFKGSPLFAAGPMGKVSPDGNWAFGLRFGTADPDAWEDRFDTLVLWRLGTAEAVVAHYGVFTAMPSQLNARWLGNDRIYYALATPIDGDAWHVDHLVMDVSPLVNGPLAARRGPVAAAPAARRLGSEFRFRLRGVGPATLSIHSLRGEELFRGGARDGGELVWAGSDGRGRPLPAGTYGYRLQQGPEGRAGRLEVRR